MTAETRISLDDERRVLRETMRAQRQVIATKLSPPAGANGGYPRSRTMRFLTSRPGLSVTVLAELAALFLGARHAKSVTAALAIARIVRSAADNESARKRAKRP